MYGLSSLRVRLLGLVLICMIPAVGLILYTARVQHRESLAEARERTTRFARLAGAAEEQFVAGARQLLVALAHLPAVRVKDTVACEEILRGLLAGTPNYLNLGAAGVDGELYCSAIPHGPTDIGDREYHLKTLATSDFAVGAWVVGRLTGQRQINFGYPVRGPDDQVSGVVFAAVNLDWLRRVAAVTTMPEEAELMLLDSQGTIIVRHPENDRWVGTRAPAALNIASMAPVDERLVETRGPDGVERVYAALPLRAANGDLRVVVGIAVARIESASRRLLFRNLMLLGLVSALALVAAWFAGDAFVLRPVRRLVRATRRLAGGELHARIGEPYADGELGHLGRAFDDMALSLELRQSERDRAQQQILRDAFHDRLTGLPNRALFVDRLGLAIERTRRSFRETFAVVALDLDRFKVVNDGLGHVIGDELLVQVGKRLDACLRPGDTCARLGGDEFAILLEQVADSDEAVALAQRLRQEIAQPFTLPAGDVFTTASLGVVVSSTAHETAEQYLRDADTAMYRAKSLGGDRAERFDSGMHVRAVERLKLDQDLRRALERRELRVVYQPVVRVSTGHVIGAEALLRWHHPERGLILPGSFIPVAEETGLIGPIGEWTLREACRQNRAWQDGGLPPLRVAVNLSAAQVRQPGLAALVERILEETGLPAANLELEITESCIMDNAEETIQVLKSLEEHGVQLSVDDFGTGYSSLRYLRRFPIHALKIDQYFINAITHHPDDAMIASAIIALAHSLDLMAIAEGVETEEQLAFLRGEGCDALQGRIFSLPLEAEAFEKLVRSGVKLPVPQRAVL